MPEESQSTVRVLFVCMGNICRSPMAEGVLRQRTEGRAVDFDIEIDSAGTHGYHEGSPPDERAQAAASRRGIDISSLAARRVAEEDFDRFDYILAMDADNLEFLLDYSGKDHREKIRLLLDYSPTRAGGDVPDPYYGGPTGFERVLDLIEEAVDRLLEDVVNAAARRGI
ncbi:MAG: low molecular weight phosphotyrosine protein phosphatase [Gammaproteobacteria bacterium]|nr:low molecular weight phosphotyrosine protein phosphatase [Gammaproteobacteria bacterium]NND36313.1 low molecular weight phosphotyrosine protein phosphatase [Gammaproteobacteria bacterium]